MPAGEFTEYVAVAVVSGGVGDLMAHVTFIHGIGNKPESGALLESWRVGLLDNDGLDLDAAGVSMSLVYWADMLYSSPLSSVSARESTEGQLEVTVPAEDADLAWMGDLPADQRRFVGALALETGLDLDAPGASQVEQAEIVMGSALEAVPLPGFLKKRLMKILLRDVHHYLYDVEYSPRPGESFRIRRDIRRRALDALRQGSEQPGPHVVVSHSLGTVVAYDVLTEVDDVPAVDALVTIGSPLGLSEVQQALAPRWTTLTGWPERGLAGRRWWNVSDPLDVVCGADPSIAGQFRRDGVPMINDVIVANQGRWRHNISSYLGQHAVREILREALGRELF